MSESIKSVLIIGKVWPESRSSAAGSRMMQLIGVFKDHGFETHFASAASSSNYSDDLTIQGVVCHKIKLNDSSFDLFVKKLNPTVVMFDRFMTEEQYGWRVAEQCPDAIRILDTEDLHSLRVTRQKCFKEGVPFHPKLMFQEEITKREMAAIYRSDLSIVISNYEMKLLLNTFEISALNLCYLPFLFDSISDSDQNELPKFDERNGFMMIGNYLHDPNRNAVKWLKNEIWPLIRSQLPDVNLNIYGSYTSPRELQMQNRKEGFYVHGRVDDVKQVISQSKVMLAPLRYGAGLKGKLFDAIQSGTPSVTTSIGCEGISDSDHWCGAVCDDPKSFADAAVNLYLNKSDWGKAQTKGVSIVRDRFLVKDHLPDFIKILNGLIENIKAHRQNQFIGSMLMHHTLAGNKYMSKWIEEKEKRGSL
tara:strand:- start:35064 stop:36320 length:1257 start_codon:yes stop_codon:yes gene_type:complete